jgi:hypothetical protein
MTKKISWTPGLTLRSRRGAALCRAGKYAQAEAELAEVIRRRGATAQLGDPILVHARRWHLHALGKMGRLADAEEDLRFLAESAAAEHGPDHRDVLAYRERHAASLWEAGRREEAATEMADVARRRALALGDDHVDTVRAAGTLAAMTSDDKDCHFGFETAGLPELAHHRLPAVLIVPCYTAMPSSLHGARPPADTRVTTVLSLGRDGQVPWPRWRRCCPWIGHAMAPSQVPCGSRWCHRGPSGEPRWHHRG